MIEELTPDEELIRKKFTMEGKTLRSENCFQALFFTWIKRLLAYGNKVVLDQTAVPEMAEGEHARDEF